MRVTEKQNDNANPLTLEGQMDLAKQMKIAIRKAQEDAKRKKTSQQSQPGGNSQGGLNNLDMSPVSSPDSDSEGNQEPDNSGPDDDIGDEQNQNQGAEENTNEDAMASRMAMLKNQKRQAVEEEKNDIEGGGEEADSQEKSGTTDLVIWYIERKDVAILVESAFADFGLSIYPLFGLWIADTLFRNKKWPVGAKIILWIVTLIYTLVLFALLAIIVMIADFVINPWETVWTYKIEALKVIWDMLR